MSPAFIPAARGLTENKNQLIFSLTAAMPITVISTELNFAERHRQVRSTPHRWLNPHTD
ncbi:hypothetical protein [cf. Phormidesmis sp. LEGE 11477]|uniref:hypothetical protein n=1 Tax=cf. Phormidesmis sp. LEGE 11477 TaxID=1828680 RepID=UPI00187EA9DB|nr:hypothetical protein [cf. Phormidesmis sp. LEGE 11477]MBE9060999.1 hypothetical protein [cf. Phormidesmis sp. LEGE 11477]